MGIGYAFMPLPLSIKDLKGERPSMTHKSIRLKRKHGMMKNRCFYGIYLIFIWLIFIWLMCPFHAFSGEGMPNENHMQWATTVSNLTDALSHVADFSMTRDRGGLEGFPFLEGGLTEKQKYLFRSKKPISKNADGSSIYLRFSLMVLTYQKKAHAKTAYGALFKECHPDTGLTYAWDAVVLADKRLMWLHAPCLLSEANWLKLSKRLEEDPLLAEAATGRIFECRCGSGCRDHRYPSLR
jgi:hypothetical protein